MSGGLEICRVCFQKTDWHATQEINITRLREIVKITQLTSLECPSLSSFKGHQICNTCITHFRTLMNLHKLVSVSNNRVKSLMTHNCNNGNTVINLKQLFHNLKENVQICRLCLKSASIVAIFLYETHYSIVPYNLVEKMLEECNLKLVYLGITSKPVLCPICWQRIQVVYAFWKHCNTVADRVDYYCKLLFKLNLSQNDLDDIVHMWDNLVEKSDSEFDTPSTYPTTHRVCLEEHNYSKKCIADYDSETLSATSSLDYEICRISNFDNIISPPSPPEIVNPSSSNKQVLNWLSRSSKFSRYNFSDSEDDLPLLDRLKKTNKVCITSNIVFNPARPKSVSVLPKRQGRPAGRKKIVQVSKRQTSKKVSDAEENSFEKLLLVTKEEILENSYRSPSNNISNNKHNTMNDPRDLPPLLKNQDEVDETKKIKLRRKRGRKPSNKTTSNKNRTIELMNQIRASFQQHKTLVEEKSSFISPSTCVKCETHDSEDSEGPPELEWQGVCGYNPKIPTIHETFSMATKKNKISPVKEITETPKKTAEAQSRSSQNEETVEFHIEPFLSDDGSKSIYSQIKEAYVLLEKCDSDLRLTTQKMSTISDKETTTKTGVVQAVLSRPLNKKSPGKPKKKLKLVNKTEDLDDKSTKPNENDILSKLFDEVKSTGILNNVKVKLHTDEKPIVKETEKPVDVLGVAQTTQKTENQSDFCGDCGAKTVDLRRHKLLRHWTNDTKLDCSQCKRRKLGASIVCLKCKRQFHPACMVTNQLFDTNRLCTHLAARHYIVLTKHCLIASETADPHDVNEPKSCECCDKPLTNYLGCEICGHYSHYKCVYDKAVGGQPICNHLPSLFRKMFGILPKGDVKCDHCKMVIDNPIPCPKCLTFMHPNCFLESLTSNCDHRDVLCYSRPSKGRNKPRENKLCDFCGKAIITFISCPKCLKYMHNACFVIDSKMMKFGCEHPDLALNTGESGTKRLLTHYQTSPKSY